MFEEAAHLLQQDGTMIAIIKPSNEALYFLRPRCLWAGPSSKPHPALDKLFHAMQMSYTAQRKG